MSEGMTWQDAAFGNSVGVNATIKDSCYQVAQAIVDRYDAGEPAAEIAEEFGLVSRYMVWLVVAASIERELQRVKREKALALFVHDRETEDWLFGAEQALSWALGEDSMAPAKAFGLRAEHGKPPKEEG